MKFSMEKLKEAILLIIETMGEKTSKVKLVKTLFYCDFTAYEKRHNPITGDRYVHYRYGPVPSHFENALRQLQKEGALVVFPNQSGRWRFEITRKSNYRIFDEYEIELLRTTARKFKRFSAKKLSDWSHLFIGWEITEENEYINYELLDMKNFNDEEKPEQFEPIDENERKLFESDEFKKIVKKAVDFALDKK